ncbi:MAG TPA: hypothetical protein VHL14_08355 [Steroidobacteraceae bacterium]|nr:hypothetical protein [Steroidobacteraceae bacterium]
MLELDELDEAELEALLVLDEFMALDELTALEEFDELNGGELEPPPPPHAVSSREEPIAITENA